MAASDDLPVAVVLCSRDRPGFLSAALDAVVAAGRPNDEILVVDSASQGPGTAAAAREKGIPVIRCDRPGLSVARNAGVAATQAPVVAFTDDDCLPRSGWTAGVAEAFADRSVGFASGRVVAHGEAGASVALMESMEPRRYSGLQDPISIGHGANMAIRRVALEGTGGFDERLGAGGDFRAGEDLDIFWRLLRDGWSGVFAPGVVVEHRQWRRRGQALRLRYGYGVGAGAFAAKAARLEGRAGRRILWDRIWSHGAAQAGRDLRNGYEMGAAYSLARAVGAAVGGVRGFAAPLDGERFRPR